MYLYVSRSYTLSRLVLTTACCTIIVTVITGDCIHTKYYKFPEANAMTHQLNLP